MATRPLQPRPYYTPESLSEADTRRLNTNNQNRARSNAAYDVAAANTRAGAPMPAGSTSRGQSQANQSAIAEASRVAENGGHMLPNTPIMQRGGAPMFGPTPATGSGNNAPFRGSTPEEIKAFQDSDPKVAAARDVAAGAGTGKTTETPYGSVGSTNPQAQGPNRDGTVVNPSSPTNWQQEVVNAHPTIGIAGHPDNLAFVKAVKDSGGGKPADHMGLAAQVTGAPNPTDPSKGGTGGLASLAGQNQPAKPITPVAPTGTPPAPPTQTPSNPVMGDFGVGSILKPVGDYIAKTMFPGVQPPVTPPVTPPGSQPVASGGASGVPPYRTGLQAAEGGLANTIKNQPPATGGVEGQQAGWTSGAAAGTTTPPHLDSAQAYADFVHKSVKPMFTPPVTPSAPPSSLAPPGGQLPPPGSNGVAPMSLPGGLSINAPAPPPPTTPAPMWTPNNPTPITGDPTKDTSGN